MPSSTPSLRELARALGLSHTTVSEALRGNARVKPETQKRVLKAANDAGYQRNPLAGALMSEMRRSRGGTFRGVIAVLDVDGPEQRLDGASRYHRELTAGAGARAAELGFKIEPFVMDARGLTLKRLNMILQSRGIRGVFLLPVGEAPDLTKLEWHQFAGVYTDYIIEKPALHTVAPDHYRAMMMVLQRLESMGYQRPGLVIQGAHDERLLYRWEAAYHVYQEHHGNLTRLPALIAKNVKAGDFARWFKEHQPDVVLSHIPRVMEWMQDCGASIPTTHGFCSLNVTTAELPCAGIDLQPRLLGSRGIELLIGQLLRNEYGVPDIPSTTTIPAAWVDGQTLKPKPEQPEQG